MTPQPNCACGCGLPVKRWKGHWATYLKGHHRRKHGDPGSWDQKYAKTLEYLFRTYGLTQSEYDRLVTAQNDSCAICNTTDKGQRRQVWCVDHDHVTGEIRGLLCHACNAALGLFKDDPALLVRAKEYLCR